ncbi:MAG TPA: RluA family pseudouridine synthase [Steroidobacteraceae bacterium]|nr:RluA family pseudouridine synthase [Steroidobacteraceae bacterium]
MVDGTAGPGPRAEVSYVEAGAGDAGQRIDNFLARHLRDLPRSRLYRLLRKGEVRVNGRRVRPEHRLAAGDRVRLPPVRRDPSAPATGQPSAALRRLAVGAILHEDDDLLVLDKPAGVAVHGGSGVSFGLIEALRAARPEATELELVHRLDRDTSGCLLVAKRRSVLRRLHAMLRERDMEKRYLALVCGRWALGAKTIELPLLTNRRQGGERVVKVDVRGQSAHSRFVPVEQFGRVATLMDVTIGTGRTHQIRVHAAYAGHPVAGDEKYGDTDCNGRLAAYGLRRMFLHAAALSFPWERAAGGRFTVEAPLDRELATVLEHLRMRGADTSTGSGNRNT